MYKILCNIDLSSATLLCEIIQLRNTKVSYNVNIKVHMNKA